MQNHELNPHANQRWNSSRGATAERAILKRLRNYYYLILASLQRKN
jgi:hypothetical protein